MDKQIDLAAELREVRKRVRELEAEIEVRDNCANIVLDTLKTALPNRGFHSEMEAAEAAREEIAELRQGIESANGAAAHYLSKITEAQNGLDALAITPPAAGEAGKDSARLNHLERLGLTTHPAGGQNKKDYGIHSWRDNETGEVRWMARYISSEFKTLRAATDASMAMEGKCEK